jgi:hypothetical protein
MLRALLARVTHNWALKLTALVIAFLLWITRRADTPSTWQAMVAVRVVNNDVEWVLAGPPSPDSVRVTFRGPLGELLRIASERPQVIVNVDEVKDSTELIQLRPTWVRMPPATGGTSVAALSPAELRLAFDPVSTRLIPIAVSVQGQPTEGFRVVGKIDIEPEVVRASGARRDLQRIDSLRVAVDLRDRRAYDTLLLMIDTTGTGLMISPRTLRVVVPIQPILVDSPATRPPLGTPRRSGG